MGQDQSHPQAVKNDSPLLPLQSFLFTVITGVSATTSSCSVNPSPSGALKTHMVWLLSVSFSLLAHKGQSQWTPLHFPSASLCYQNFLSLKCPFLGSTLCCTASLLRRLWTQSEVRPAASLYPPLPIPLPLQAFYNCFTLLSVPSAISEPTTLILFIKSIAGV